MNVVLNRLCAELVHHLKRCGHHAIGDDGAYGFGAVFNTVKVEQHRANGWRILGETHTDLCGNAKHALAAHERTA